VLKVQFETTPTIYQLRMEDLKMRESSNDAQKSLLLGKMGEAVMLLTCILDMTGSSL
jgi:hypothetical protein